MVALITEHTEKMTYTLYPTALIGDSDTSQHLLTFSRSLGVSSMTEECDNNDHPCPSLGLVQLSVCN